MTLFKGGGHGNYKAVVLAPSSVQEMCDLTIKAFELAYKYRSPAIVLADENMLMPVLHSLPETHEEFNITMGYPVQETPRS